MSVTREQLEDSIRALSGKDRLTPAEERRLSELTRDLSATVGHPTGLWRDFRPRDLLQASDLGELWISPDFRPRM
jgi:hypothetical protein